MSYIPTLELLQNAATATGDGERASLAGYSAVLCQVTGTFVGTVTFEGSADDGTTWTTVEAINLSNSTRAGTATTTGNYLVACPGMSDFRARISAYTSGSITVKARKVELTATSVSDVELTASDIQIGAVEIKNATSDDRATVAADGRLATDANLQVGNADSPGGSGVVTASTPRVVLATDVALPAGTNVIGDVSPAEWSITATADNAAATATRAAEAGKSHYITAIFGSFSAAAIKLATLKDGTTVIGNYYVHNADSVPLARPLKITSGAAAELSLAASGTAGVIGAVTLKGYTR